MVGCIYIYICIYTYYIDFAGVSTFVLHAFHKCFTHKLFQRFACLLPFTRLQDVEKEKESEANKIIYQRFCEKWKYTGDIPDIVEQPDPNLEWGLGCSTCIAYAATLPDLEGRKGAGVWGVYQFGTEGTLQFGLLKRHCCAVRSHSKFHRRAVAAIKDVEEQGELNDQVATAAQFSANYEAVLTKANVALAYEDHCKVARRSGDVVNFPAVRCNRYASDNCTKATEAAITRDQHIKIISKTNPLSWATISEDGRAGVQEYFLRCAFKNYDVEDILLDLKESSGKKAASHPTLDR